MPYTVEDEAPYDATAREPDPETPPFDAVLHAAIEQAALRLRVMLPAQIVQVVGDQEVDVQPMLQARYSTQQDAVDLPILKNVPVLMFAGQKFLLRLPLSPGDNGIVLFCDRSLDAWLASNGQNPVDPKDTRAHNLSDGVFIPGLVPSGQMTSVGTDDLTLVAGQSQVTLQQNGRMKIGSNASGGQELLSLLSQTLQAQSDLLGALQSAQVLTAMGPAPFLASSIASFAQTQATVNQLKVNLDTLKV